MIIVDFCLRCRKISRCIILLYLHSNRIFLQIYSKTRFLSSCKTYTHSISYWNVCSQSGFCIQRNFLNSSCMTGADIQCISNQFSTTVNAGIQQKAISLQCMRTNGIGINIKADCSARITGCWINHVVHQSLRAIACKYHTGFTFIIGVRPDMLRKIATS